MCGFVTQSRQNKGNYRFSGPIFFHRLHSKYKIWTIVSNPNKLCPKLVPYLYMLWTVTSITSQNPTKPVLPVIWFPLKTDIFSVCILKYWPLRAPLRLVFCSVQYGKESICKSISAQQYVYMVERSSLLNNYNYQSKSCSTSKTASLGFSDFHPSAYKLCWVMGACTLSLYTLKWLIQVFVFTDLFIWHLVKDL